MSAVPRKICVVTGTRAEYGLLRWLMEGIRDDSELDLQLIVTGMHLSPEFGLTYRDIEADGFRIDRKIEMLTSSDTPVGIAKSMGLGLIGFADALDQISPDLLVVLGDRFEIFAAVSGAMTARIPVAHLHGGEATEGLIDEAIRHSITKMSHLHFVATKEYQQRVIQLGEKPDSVFLVGGLGVDCIQRIQLLNRTELEHDLGFAFGEKNLLVTFHPVTLESASSKQQMHELLAALATVENSQLIITLPNADTDGRILIDMIHEFAKRYDHAHVFPSLGQLRYLSCVAQVDGVIGNSSSGLAEVPSFKTGTVNIGDRQRGRIKAPSVIDCVPREHDIRVAIETLYTDAFLARLERTYNPYGSGGASNKICDIIRTIDLSGLLKKQFYDLGHSCV